MYIKLIQPRMKKRPMDTDIKPRMSPPLGLLTIAAMLRDRHKVVIQNENIAPLTYDSPDIVGITVTVDALPRACEIAEKFRRNGAVVVAGGIHITTAEDYVPEDAFDVLCVGPAEGTWDDIVRDFENGCLKKKYRCRPMTGHDIIPPAYDMVKSSEYLYCNIVHTGRGCPFRCDFCYNSSKQRRFMNRDIDDVIAEIEKIGSKHIMFIDDNFAGNISYTRELVRRLKALDIKWNAAVSANIIDYPDLLDEMRDSGCKGLFIGFESIDPASVGGVHKVQNDTRKYEAVVRELHSRGIMINASFVFGLDGDTPDTFKATLDWIVKNKIETVTSHILTPYPGTALYERMKAEGRLLTDDLSLYNTANVVFKPKNMTEKQLYDGYVRIYRDIYSFKNIIRRMPRTKAQIPAYLMFNIFYRKFGRFTDALCRLVSYEKIGLWGEKLSRYINTVGKPRK
ncbi:MAG: B12-binding domain-containing radical SAM protein [Firmicutes bacterium]|nr:B12-binding domain-containing radical SAM protein [Bacillota bacterium]